MKIKLLCLALLALASLARAGTANASCSARCAIVDLDVRAAYDSLTTRKVAEAFLVEDLGQASGSDYSNLQKDCERLKALFYEGKELSFMERLNRSLDPVADFYPGRGLQLLNNVKADSPIRASIQALADYSPATQDTSCK